MSEMKRNFTKGKMNKDLDERLVPPGEYRDAMNIQVSTSEDSDVGAVQNILGNIEGCDYVGETNPIYDGSSTIGSISDEKNDQLYWLVAGPAPESISTYLPLNDDEFISFKDIIMRTNTEQTSGCEPVFVDKYAFLLQYSGGVGSNSYIPLENTDLYSNINVGMNVTGFDNDGNIQFGPSLITSIGPVNILPIIYQSGDELYDPPPTTSATPWSIRGFWNASQDNSNAPPPYNANDGRYSHVFSLNSVTDWDPVNSTIVAPLSPPPTGAGNMYNIQLIRAGHNALPPEWVVDTSNPAIITQMVDVSGETFYQATSNSTAYKIVSIEFTNIVPTYAFLDPLLGSGPSAYTVVTLSPQDLAHNNVGDFTFDDLLATTGASNSWNSPVMAYEGLNVTATYDPPVASTYVPNNEITIIETQSAQWLDDIYNIYYDENGNATGNYLQIVGNMGAGVSFPDDSCIDPDSVIDILGFDPDTGTYDNVFEIVGCPGTVGDGDPMPPAIFDSRPLYFQIIGDGIDAVHLNETVDLTDTDALYFQSNKVLNFDKDRLVTGINIVDNMLFWTDNFSEPKKINIDRSVEGTDYDGEKHTVVVNKGLDYGLSNIEHPVKEEHITVIRKNPKKALTLSFDTGRDPDLIYSGILYTGDTSSPNGSSIISSSNTTIQDDFSSAITGDTIRFNIPFDTNNQSVFKLEWKTGDTVLLMPFDDTGAAPVVPLSSHVIRGRLTSWHSQKFDTATSGTVDVEIEVLSINGTPPQPAAGDNLNYVIDLEDKEEPIFETKFPRFSYRYKYEDGEYSVFAPFSEVAFIPGSFNYDPKEGFNKGMVNRIKNITISDFISQDLPTDVTEIDILYKEEVSPNIYLVETISPTDMVATDSVSNAWHLNKYIVNSETIKNIISSNQLLRSWDNVPKKALAQEVVGSRIVYGNYEQNYDLSSNSQKYKPDFKNSLTTWGTTTQGVAQKSIKSLRDYKLGVVFTDKYGRETPVLISESGGFKINKENSDKANRLMVGLKGVPPANMSYFKFFIKETSTEYYNLPMDRWYAAEDGNIWIAFPSSDRNKVDLDTTLFLKKGDDINAIKNNSKYKILAIENEAPEFIKTRKIRIGTRTHDTTSIVDNTNVDDPIYANIFGTLNTPLLNAPRVNGISFDINYLQGGFAGTSMSNLEDITEDLYVNFRSNNDISSQYKVAELTSDYDSTQPRDATNPTKYSITVATNFKEDIGFIFDNPTAPLAIKDGIKIQFTKAIVENSPKFEGRFFAKIKNDGKIKLNIDSSFNVNYIETASKMVYSLEDDDALKERATNSLAGITATGCTNMDTNPYYAPCPDNFIADSWSTHIQDASHFPGTISGQTYDSSGINFNHYYSRVVYFSNRSVDGVGVAIGGGSGWQGSDEDFGVWFIDKSTLKYEVAHVTENLSWPQGNDPNDMSFATPGISFWSASHTGSLGPFTATTNTGNGIYNGINEDGDSYSKVELAFGGIRGIDLDLEGDLNDVDDPNNYEWFLYPNPLEDFFSIGNGNDYHNDESTRRFVEKINSGFSFKWEHDPTETIYTIYDGFNRRHNLRFGKNDQGYSPMMSQFFDDPSSYHKTWGFKVTPSMEHWNPARPTGATVGNNALNIGDKVYAKTCTFPNASTTLTVDAGGGTSNVKIGMVVYGTGIDTGVRVTNVIESTNEILISKPTASAQTSVSISFGYTIRPISNNFVSYAGGECYMVVDEIQGECVSNGGVYSLHKGMKLVTYNTDSSITTTTDQNVIIKSIGPFDESLGPDGGYKITLTGQSKPLDVLNEFSTGMALNERVRFQQVAMNSVSNNVEAMTDYTSADWPTNDLGNPTAGIGAIGYKMIFVEPVEEYDDGGVLPPDPYIWETEPKEDTNLDLYYEISENNPIYLNSDTINTAIPLGSTVKTFSNEGGIGHFGNVTVISNNFANGRTITISELAWAGSTSTTSSTSGAVIPPIEVGSILLITKPNGITFGIQVAEVIPHATLPDVSRTFVIEDLIYHSNYRLNWHNCYSFGNGVESNRIRDAFNLPFIINGVKASTTLNEEYKLERRKSGLIYSGLYNSTSGINNLNQFIQAEKITKDLNPVYGSIQKLHTRDSNLVALCEDKILKILANKDAVFNADGNTQLTATENVLGQTIPFVGEYGISTNPESFASESYRAYFSDKVRGAIMRLSADGLTPISNHGMKDWFRDNLKLSSKIIGSYDDKKDEYNVTLDNANLGMNRRTVTFKEDVKGWVSFKSFTPENAISCANEYYTFRQGNLWRHHHEDADRNTFYNLSLYPSEITVLFNDVPGSVKTFHTLNYEGSQSRIIQKLSYDIFDPESWDGSSYLAVSQNIKEENYYNLEDRAGWFVQDIHTNLEEGGLKEFIEKEGKWFNYIHGKPGSLANSVGLLTPTASANISFQGLGQMAGQFTPQTIHGCTNPTATNYNPSATEDNGSCIYSEEGCPDVNATNYNPGAIIDDGSCLYSGCTDPTMFNYDSAADIDDGSCTPIVMGCTDSSPLIDNGVTYYYYVNYDDSANTDDGSCVAAVLGCIDPNAVNYNPAANTQVTAGDYADGVCDYNIYGCMDAGAINYDCATNINPGSTTPCNDGVTADDGSCVTPTVGCMDVDAYNYDPTANTACFGCCIAVVDGCTDPTAFNYDASANTDDGSCIPFIYGCTDPIAFNYDSSANTDDNSCVAVANGCTDPNAFNYDSNANTDDGSCIAVSYGCTDATACNYNASANTDDSSCYYPDGCTDPLAFNYDSLAQCDDGSCIAVVLGCIDPTADNYNSSANTDDGSCTYPILGCTDPTATNYDSSATQDDGSCIACVYGCTDASAFNYSPLATCDDSSCIAVALGCTDPTATNYDSTANTDDGSCIAVVNGCTDSTACNFDASANTNDGSCTYPAVNTNCDGTCASGYVDVNGVCVAEVFGCTDPMQYGYNAAANVDDGSCEPYVFGCTQGAGVDGIPHINYDQDANNIGCHYPVHASLGYTGDGTDGFDPCVTSDPNDPNYNQPCNPLNADGTVNYACASNYCCCIDEVSGCTTTGFVEYNPAANVDDGTCSTPAVYGCMDATADNYDGSANVDDGSCTYTVAVLGCTDSSADNYDPNATVDDGSCTYPPCNTWQTPYENSTLNNFYPTTAHFLLNNFEGGSDSPHDEDNVIFANGGQLGAGSHFIDTVGNSNGYVGFIEEVAFGGGTAKIYVNHSYTGCPGITESGGIMFKLKPTLGSAFWWEIYDVANGEYLSHSRTFPTASGPYNEVKANGSPKVYTTQKNVRAKGNNASSDYQLWSGYYNSNAITDGETFNMCIPNDNGKHFLKPGNYKLEIYFFETWAVELANPAFYTTTLTAQYGSAPSFTSGQPYGRPYPFTCPISIPFTVSTQSNGLQNAPSDN